MKTVALLLVDWAQARTWNVGGKHFLVALVDVSVLAGDYHICGMCPRRFFLAVLEQRNHSLQLVASGVSGFYGGHREAELDLAPYRLTDDENLIGLRVRHVWWMTQQLNTMLELYRVVKPHVQLIFRARAEEHWYPDGMNGPVIAKMVTTLVTEKASSTSPYYSLSVTRQFFAAAIGLRDQEHEQRELATAM